MAVSSNLSQPSQKKQVRSEGGGVPQWLLDLGIGPGEFYFETKPRFVRLMRDTSWPEKARVFACLSLHTMGFQTEVATKLVKGQRQPLTRADIASETGILSRNVRRALVQLETEGYCERGSGQDENRVIRCWANPRPGTNGAPVEIERLVVELPADIPDYLARWMRRYKISAIEPARLDRAKELAARVEQDEHELRAWIKPEEEPKQRAARGPVKNSPQGAARGRLGVRRTSPPPQPTAKIPEGLNGTDRKGKILERVSSSSKAEPSNGNGMMMTAEIEQVSEVLAQYCSPETAAVRALIQNCRVQLKDATVTSICDAIHLKGRKVARYDDPLAFLMVAVPNAMTGTIARPAPTECTCGHRGQCAYCHTV